MAAPWNIRMVKTSTVYKQLFEMMPRPEEFEHGRDEEGDGFEDFVKERDEA